MGSWTERSAVDKTTLLYGPYAAPPLSAGETAVCRIRGRVTVAGMTAALIPWPLVRTRGGPARLIVCGDLVRAIRRESVAAIVHHWDVSQQTVWRWKKAIGVGRMTAGTKEVYRRLLPRRIHSPEAMARAKVASHTPELMARRSAARKGKPVSLRTQEAAAKAARRKRTKAHREAIARGVRQAIRSGKFWPRSPTGKPWTEKELALLGQTLDRHVAAMTGRSLIAVRAMRRRLWIAASRHAKLPRGKKPRTA